MSDPHPSERYSFIKDKNPREIVLLRGSGCRWRRCRFCNYHLDFSHDQTANDRLNAEVLARVTGKSGVLEMINSGSFCDLSIATLDALVHVCTFCTFFHARQSSTHKSLYFQHLFQIKNHAL